MKKIFIFTFCLLTFAIHAQVKKVYLAAEMNQTHYLDDGTNVEMWGYGLIKLSGAYNASLPGPVLEFNLGDTVEVHFHNTTPEDHTIHLHGLDVSMEEDGVPMTSMAIDPGDSIIYDFVANNAGTFLYHCHVLTTLHLTMGMYGVIVVKNFPEANLIYSGGPSFQKEHVFLASDMDKSVNVNPLSPGSFHLFQMDYFMINGLSGDDLLTDIGSQVTAYPGDSVLLRLANIGYSKTRFIFPEEVNAIAHSSDGRVLPAPLEADTLIIYPGERYEVLLVPTGITDVDIQVEGYESRNDQIIHVNYISLNGDIGMYEALTEGLSVYPNPTNDVLHIETPTTGSLLSIFDVSGKIILQQIVTEEHTMLNVAHLEQGIYLVNYDGATQRLVVSE